MKGKTGRNFRFETLFHQSAAQRFQNEGMSWSIPVRKVYLDDGNSGTMSTSPETVNFRTDSDLV